MTERTTWPLWECLSPASLKLIKDFQWQEHGLKLELLRDRYSELEGLEEIDHLIRDKRPAPRQVK